MPPYITMCGQGRNATDSYRYVRTVIAPQITSYLGHVATGRLITFSWYSSACSCFTDVAQSVASAAPPAITSIVYTVQWLFALQIVRDEGPTDNYVRGIDAGTIVMHSDGNETNAQGFTLGRGGTIQLAGAVNGRAVGAAVEANGLTGLVCALTSNQLLQCHSSDGSLTFAVCDSIVQALHSSSPSTETSCTLESYPIQLQATIYPGQSP